MMFTFEDAKEAVEIRLKSVNSDVSVSDGTIRAILEKTGGHPYLLMFTMHELLNMLEVKTIEVESFDQHSPRSSSLVGRSSAEVPTRVANREKIADRDCKQRLQTRFACRFQ